MRSFAGTMIKIAVFFQIALMAALTALSFIAGVWIMGIILAVFTVLLAWFFYAARHRIVRFPAF